MIVGRYVGMDGVHRAYALGLRYRNDEKKNITSQKSTILHSTNFLLSLAVWPQWVFANYDRHADQTVCVPTSG